MPISTVNPFNPLTWWTAGVGNAGPVYPTQPTVKKGTPIAIKGESSDKGCKLTVGKNQVTISGTTKGPATVGQQPFTYTEARGMSFTLDIDKAPTTDVFGNTDYTEKNSRLFTLTTEKGWSAEKCARMLAAKVNAGDDFKATVKVTNGTATVSFTRR